MKRKNLRQAIVLGLVMASLGSCVWAAEYKTGINFNVGYGLDKPFTIDNEVKENNGIYVKDFGEENITVSHSGIFFTDYSQKMVELKQYELSTKGDLIIDHRSYQAGGSPIAKGAITIDMNNDSLGYIEANNIYLNNYVNIKGNTGRYPSYTAEVSGIVLHSNEKYNEEDDKTTTTKLNLTALNDISFYDFNKAITMQDNTELNIKAKNITFDFNKDDFLEDDEKYPKSATGIYININDNNTLSKQHDVNTSIRAGDSIYFTNMDTVANIHGNNINVDISAEQNIIIRTDNKSNIAAISLSANKVNSDDTEYNKSSKFTMKAKNKILIDNYQQGIKVDYNTLDANDTGSKINLYSNDIELSNIETGIDIIGENTEVFLGDYEDDDKTKIFDNLISIDACNTAINVGEKSVAKLNGYVNKIIGGTNAVISKSKAVVDITGAENFIGNTADNGTDVLAEQERHALYASNAGSINVTANGGMNTIVSDGYRTIHAEGDGSFTTTDINITGGVYIANKNAFPSVKSALADENISKIAIVASSNSTLANGVVNIDLNGTNTIRSGISEDNYKGEYAGGNVIYGSVIAGKDGKVNINTNLPSNKTLADTSENRGSISVYGNVMAGNKGELNLDLGNGGYLEGRVDDYQDAAIKDVNENHGNGFYNPEFSKEITDRGEVNLTMGDKAYWNVTEQSWVSSLTATGAGVVIDMVGENNGTHAVTIENMHGNANFKMSLNGETKTDSDMLYMKHAEGSYNIYLDRIVTDSEIGEDGLRFATVGDGSSAEFKVFASDKGFFDKEYTVGSEDYIKGDSENSDYNGDSLDNRKPGEDAVDNYFDGTYNENIITLAGNEDGLLDKDTNFKLVGSSSEISDGGETILNMSRANYSNAVYMDRLNKRLGEARYIDGDEGIWMRLRHDRIGKQDDFRSMNTMYEIGYDRKADVDNGQRRIGIAGDYMQGSTEYTGVSGSGEIKRIGLWAYDTWLGDKGHYTDYVVKWGHLSNDFNLFRNEKISGDYSNDVFSVSAEYGKKNDIGGDWYFEPQAQLQYAYVTDAQYSSSQGTEVDVDSIHSLIARGGFRIGKDFGSEKKSTVYFKADIMHEFLGDQDIAVRDSSTDGRWTTVGYGNEGTWFDVGFGFAAQTGDNSYVYLDLEQSFGNDNEDTYQINAGMQWSF